MMYGRDRALTLARQALALIDNGEVTVTIRQAELTRFARSAIHQPVSERDIVLSFRVLGNSTGRAECNSPAIEAMRAAAARARELAVFPGKPPAPLARPQRYGDVRTAHDDTLEFSASARASAVTSIVRTAGEFEAAGTVARDITETAIVNTNGLEGYQATTLADAMVIMSSDRGSGYARRLNRSASAIDFEQLAVEARDRCRLNRDATDLQPGRYTVLLSEYAGGDMIAALSAMCFGAEQFRQGTSFVSGRMGQRLLGKQVTITDDGLDPAGLPTLFDAEGVAKRRVELVRDGTAEAVVHDLTTARDQDTESTGHASTLGAGSPLASNLFLLPGTTPRDQLVGKIERGVLVTRFHYIALVHPTATRWSGMTRDGTFLIEDGRVTRPVMNLRFDDRIAASLSNITEIARETMITAGYAGCAVVPAFTVDGFRFTGSTR